MNFGTRKVFQARTKSSLGEPSAKDRSGAGFVFVVALFISFSIGVVATRVTLTTYRVSDRVNAR